MSPKVGARIPRPSRNVARAVRWPDGKEASGARPTFGHRKVDRPVTDLMASGAKGGVPPGTEPRRAHTITVVSARGGSGKTMLAANLAAVLAQRPGETTVLADLNLEFPAAALSLKARPALGIADIVEANAEIGDDDFEEMLVHHPSGLRVLSASLEAGESERISDDGLRAVLDRLVRLYDHVVMDCRPSFRNLYLDIWESSDQILVVCPPDVVSVVLTRNLMDAMAAVGVDSSRLHVVLNQIVPTPRLRTAEISRQIDAEKFEIPYAGATLHHAEDEGRVYALDHPRDAAARAMRNLANELAGRAPGPPQAAGKSGRRVRLPNRS
jgi:pilus assembly protein CpaE